MKYRNLIITLGFIVIFIQFLGFPQAWRDVLYILSGLLVITFGYLSEAEKKTAPTQP
ncbi:MAG: hypothetical protein RLZZ67_152 [Candidatus Parcubacteria bacterium]|jgi:hypothetical protein